MSGGGSEMEQMSGRTTIASKNVRVACSNNSGSNQLADNTVPFSGCALGEGIISDRKSSRDVLNKVDVGLDEHEGQRQVGCFF